MFGKNYIMATYKKRGGKKSIRSEKNVDIIQDSKTAEVFETLDSTASKTEEWVVKYQNVILVSIGLVAMIVLSYLGYQNFIILPKSQEATSELNQAQYYFELAVNAQSSDSLYRRALNGGEGKYGFLDIIENYGGTDAAQLATYSAGMSFLNLKDYKNAISYLDKFNGNDIMLSSLSKGAIGDAFAQLGQYREAYDYYITASSLNNNLYSTPKYLYKAAIIGSELGELSDALELLKRIKKDYPKSNEANLVEVQIARLEKLNN